MHRKQVQSLGSPVRSCCTHQSPHPSSSRRGQPYLSSLPLQPQCSCPACMQAGGMPPNQSMYMLQGGQVPMLLPVPAKEYMHLPMQYMHLAGQPAMQYIQPTLQPSMQPAMQPAIQYMQPPPGMYLPQAQGQTGMQYVLMAAPPAQAAHTGSAPYPALGTPMTAWQNGRA